MITIKAVLDGAGLLKTCEIRGHAGAGKRGSDIVCSAVSVLAKTALMTLSGREGISVRGGPGERGSFSLETEALTGGGREFLAATGAFLLNGLESVAGEYPQNCGVTILMERRD
ncbi:MAG: ribosomal-processing cysteine protease Prp [Treponema sp.]|jgi:uncharacterized protein YsxB (DUF464 family)|nr:ribosomal-processing cysteine protease Prp [Treponema sp.]